jgi:small-conductance mechanosensitive channel
VPRSFLFAILFVVSLFSGIGFSSVATATSNEHAPAASHAAAAPSAAPSASAAPTGEKVKLGDETVYLVRGDHHGTSAKQRAKEAAEALERAKKAESISDVTVARVGDTAVLSIGKTPIIELGPEDAELAGADSLDVHAAQVASRVKQALTNERQRTNIANTVFSLSLVVFLGLIAFYLIQKVGEFSARSRAWFEARPSKDLAVRFRTIEVLQPAMVRSAGTLGISLLTLFAQIGVVYAWLLLILSMFESTKGYTQKLTGLVIDPLSGLLKRLATQLPMVALAILAGFAVLVLVRFVGLFFASVSRGETLLKGLPRDLAAPTSVLVRVAIVFMALVFAAPLVTGAAEGALGRVGGVAALTFGLAAVPLAASILLGSITLYGRKLRVGDYVEIKDVRGQVVEIGLLSLRLSHDDLEVNVPHLYSAWHPLRVKRTAPSVVPSARPSAPTNPSVRPSVAPQDGGEA